MKNPRTTFFSHTFSALLAVCMPIMGCSTNNAVSVAEMKPAAALLGGNGFTIYAAGDIADCAKSPAANSAAAKTAALIAAGLASGTNAAVLTLGDNAYPKGLPAEFTNCYDPTWGQFKARTYPSPGNHEYYSAGGGGYYGYFGDAAGPDLRGYYSVDLGKWHIVSLNSNLKDKEHQAQLDWLKTDLAAHKAACTLAYWHHPVFSSGGHGNNVQMKDVWDVLQAGDADLVLNGHDHNYERFAPQDGQGNRDDKRGIREFVVGTGGAKLTMLGLRKQNSEASDNASHGILKLVLKDSGYEWEFLPVAGETFTDHGVGLCH